MSDISKPSVEEDIIIEFDKDMDEVITAPSSLLSSIMDTSSVSHANLNQGTGDLNPEEVDVNRLCGPRKTKENNAYTHDELVYLVVKKGIYDQKTASRLNLETLCRSLKIPYTDQKMVGTIKILFDDYPSCLKKNKKDIIEENKEILINRGIPLEIAKGYKKANLCHIIYQEESPFVVPEDFDETKCGLYDIPTLIRIATVLNIDVTRAKYLSDYCRIISLYYKRKKMTFNTDISKTWDPISEQDYKCMIPLAKDLELQDHQKRVVRHILTHRGLLAVHATGSGKTLTAVTAMNCMMAKYPNIKVLVVTPLSLVDNFKENIIQFGLSIDDPEFISRVDIKGYDEYINSAKRANAVDCANTFLIIDEAHNFRTDPNVLETKIEKGSKTYTMMKCASQAFKVLLLTATPIVNDIYDLRNLMAMIDGIDPVNIPTRMTFVESVQTRDGLTELVKCKTSYYEAPKENFPERIDIPVDETRIYMSKEYYDKYMTIEISKASPILLSGITLSDINKNYFKQNLRMAINALDREQSPKIDWIYNFIVKEAEEGRKTIVYSNFKKAGMNLLRKRLDELGKPNLYAYITGEVSTDIRRIVKKKYNRGDVKILLISRAGGEGLNLKNTRNVIIMESNWNPAIDEQIIGRAIRYKSHEKLPIEERNVRVYKILLSKPKGNSDQLESVDDILWKLTEKKKESQKIILEIIKENSIEQQSCICVPLKQNDLSGCQNPLLPERYIKVLPEEETDEKKEKLKGYEAPSSTSIGIELTDVGRRKWLKLAGLKQLPQSFIDLKKRAKKIELKDIIFDEDEITFEPIELGLETIEKDEITFEPIELELDLEMSPEMGEEDEIVVDLNESSSLLSTEVGDQPPEDKDDVINIKFNDETLFENIYTLDDPDAEIEENLQELEDDIEIQKNLETLSEIK